MKRGFTLLELSVVLAILAVVMASGLTLLTVSVQQAQYDDTVNKIAVIEKAIQEYSIAFGRIPCPSSLTLPPTSSYYGAEAGSSTAATIGTGECVTGMTPAATYKSVVGNEEGGIPTRALQLPDSYMYDGWGRRFRYAVDPNYTGYTFYSKPPFPTDVCYTSTKSITVYGFNNTVRTTTAVYVIISHGANGHGAYTKTGGQFNGASSNQDEQTNCHCDGSIHDNGNSVNTLAYVQHAPNNSSPGSGGNTTYRFDDIVAFKQAWQMQNANSEASAANCAPGTLWVADYGRKRIVEINTLTGAYVTSISNTTTPSFPFGNTNSVAVDRAGNIWVADNKNRVIELDSSGNWKKTLGGKTTDLLCAGVASGSGCSNISNYDGLGNQSHCCVPSSGSCSCTSSSNQGAFSKGGGPMQIAFDNTGNLWVTDSGRLEEFNTTTGAFIQSVPFSSGSPSALALIPGSNAFWIVNQDTAYSLYKYVIGGTPTATYNGIGVEGSASDYASIDANGNVWISDEGLNKVSGFNSAGTAIVNTLTPSGVDQNTGVFFDSQGYAWLSSEDTNALYKVDSSGNILQTITSANGINFSSPQLSYSYAR